VRCRTDSKIIGMGGGVSTDPVFLLPSVAADRLVLAGPEGRHAAGSKRLRPGETVDVVDGAGVRAHCVVTAVGREEVHLEVTARTHEPAPDPRLTLVQALPKGDRGELAVELATELGVDAVIPWAAARCVTQWKADRGDKAHGRWLSTAREAAKQSRRAWLPSVEPLHTTKQLGARLDGATVLVLDAGAVTRLVEVPLPGAGEVALVVGPEGGIGADELAALGGTPVRLGPGVLRTSTAGAAALAALSARVGRW
jgi:16S rRNA (uracil1498-N3)-methyltransferase